MVNYPVGLSTDDDKFTIYSNLIFAMCLTNENIFDQVERDVLEQVHKRLSLLFRNERDAIRALLRCYAQILRDLRTGRIAKSSNDTRFQTANEGFRGLGHCLRWIRKCCPLLIVIPNPQGGKSLHDEALELLRWGVQYDPVFGEHSAYRGRLVKVNVDEQPKKITFLPQDNVDPHFFCSQVEAKKADDKRLAEECPEGQLAQLSKVWFDSVQISNCGLHFDDKKISQSGAIDVAAKWMEKTCLPELAATTMLHGCTVAELRRVLAGLYVYSLFVTRLEDVVDDQPSRGFTPESRIISGSKTEMVSWLAGLSGVSRDSVDAIVTTLTFAPDHPHVTVAQQPFISSRDGHLFLLPRMLMAISLGLPRMYVGALNSTPEGRQIYSHVINDIEINGVQTIAANLPRQLPSSFQIVERRTFRLDNGQNPITPDIVVLSNKNELLVIDVKFATPPFGPLDVKRDLSEMEKWKLRMSEYVTIFQQYPEILAQHFNWSSTSITAVYGLILMRWPFPIPTEFPEPISAVDWASLNECLSKTQLNLLSDLLNWIRKRPDLPMPKALVWTQKEVKAGDWTYIYFVLSSPTPSY